MSNNWYDYEVSLNRERNEIYISSPANADTEKFFYHETEDKTSIEIGTHNEQLISEAVSLCKSISNDFLMLDTLLTVLNENNKINACFRMA